MGLAWRSRGNRPQSSTTRNRAAQIGTNSHPPIQPGPAPHKTAPGDNQPQPSAPPKAMLDTLITSRTRVKLLLKFFTNEHTSGYLRGLADEFGESTNAVRTELNRMSDANLITSETNGRRRLYRANPEHPLFPELTSVTRKYLGLHTVQNIIERLGSVHLALVTGDYARGQDTGIIDLVIVGNVNEPYLNLLVKKAEDLISRKIRTLLISPEEYAGFQERFAREKALILWENGV